MLVALFVTFLWSTSWVLIKIGLKSIPALSFAGLRYALAALILGAIVLRSESYRKQLRHMHWRDGLRLGVLGLIFYAIAQGSQFAALAYLPAVTLNLLLNFTTIVIALFGVISSDEAPARSQWLGIGLALMGAVVYFYPVNLPQAMWIGLGIGMINLLGNAYGSVVGRRINRHTHLSPLVVTFVSMSVGSALLLLSGLSLSGWPAVDGTGWAIIIWMAVVNTALGFTLWNLSQRWLTAVESSVINNTMLIQIALLAWVFLGETISTQDLIGMVLVGAGTLLVQVRRIGLRRV